MMKFMMIRKALGTATRQAHALAASEIIKPSVPTPSHLKTYKLSSLDQFSTRKYMPFIFFYPNLGKTCPSKAADTLKSSLSQTLTQFYPFAGRLTGGVLIDCNDQGLEFREARINHRISDLMEDPEHEAMDMAFPPGSMWGDPYKSSASPLMIQLNHFDCGGIGLVVSMSHKFADGASFCTFMCYWAGLARQAGNLVPPLYVPTKTASSIVTIPEIELGTLEGGVTRRLMFSNAKIAELKAKLASEGVQNPTRVQVLTALLFKSALIAAAENNNGTFIPSMLFQFVNMRPKLAPPLPSHALGNFYQNITTLVTNEKEAEVPALAEQLHRDKGQIQVGVEELDGNDTWTKVANCVAKKAELYMCTSMCRFPFSDMDFGWGKPAKVTLREACNKNLFILMDTATGDGVDVIVNLEQERMPAFEKDKDLVAFTS